MLVHTAQVRGRKIAWDKREVVQHGLNADRIKFDLDAEFRACDSYQVVLCGPSLESPKRYIPDKDMTVAVPPSLMESTGPVSTCLLGYVGGEVRIVTAQERYPLVVVESGFTGTLDPGEEQPDLWAQIMSAEAARIEAELAREAAETARADAEAKRVEAEKGRETASAEAVKAANDAAAKAEEAARLAESRVTAALAEVAKAEQSRDEAEKARDASEKARGASETARADSERKREVAEAKRQADTARAVSDAESAASEARAAASKAEAGETSREAEEAKRAASETARKEAEDARKASEQDRETAETGRVEAEATRAANESKRTETFNTNLVSWTTKVDAACQKATDTASKAAQDAKKATDAAIAKTEEATNAAVAKAQTATDNATTAANKAEAAVAKLPLPLGNTLKGEVESTMVSVHDAYPAPLITAKVMGQSNQQQEPAPSPENPQEITNLNKAEIVTAGKNLLEIYSLPNQPDSGISASMENDKSVIVNGMTTSSNIDIKIIGENTRVTLPAGVYTFSVDSIGFPKDCIFFIRNASDNTWFANTNVEKPTITISLDKPTIISECSVRIPTAGTKFSNARIAVQLEVGGKATGYTAPATKALTPIDLKGNELLSIPNGVRDEVVIDAEGNVSLIKRVAKYVVPENVYAQDEPDNFGVKLELNAVDGNYLHKQLCPENAKYNPSANWMSVWKEGNSWANLQEFKQWFIGTEFYYGTKKPQTIPLGKVELPALPESTSNIWNDGNIPANVYVQYLKDVNIAFADLESKLTQAVVAAAANL